MAPDEVHEEELDTPRPSRWPLVVAAFLAVVVLAAVIIRAHKTSHASLASLLPPSKPPASPSFTETPLCPEADDGQNACSTVDHVPAGFVRAVVTLFPGTRAETARTDVVRGSAYSPPDPLWYRFFTARSDDVEVAIQIRQLEPGDRDTLSTEASTYATISRLTLIHAHHWAVLISVVSIGVPAPTPAQLHLLASDERLFGA